MELIRMALTFCSYRGLLRPFRTFGSRRSLHCCWTDPPPSLWLIMQSSECLLRVIECFPRSSTDFSLYASLVVTCPDSSHPYSFFAEAQRITADDYVPSIEDIGRVPENPVKGVMEAHFKIHGLSIRVLQIYSQQSYRRKWIEPFLDAMNVIFFTSLSDYNEPGISRMSLQVCVSSCV